MKANHYQEQSVLCLKYWLERRVPAEHLSALRQIVLPYDIAAMYDRTAPVAAIDYWGSSTCFGALISQLNFFAKFLCAGMDQLIPSSVLLDPMREATAALIPAPLFDKCVNAYTHLVRMANVDVTSDTCYHRLEQDLMDFIVTLGRDEDHKDCILVTYPLSILERSGYSLIST